MICSPAALPVKVKARSACSATVRCHPRRIRSSSTATANGCLIPRSCAKSDGGFNYTTTDLATVDYRLKTWSPNEIVYVVDDRQSGHFKKLFLIVARWKPEAAKSVKLVHVGFGKILGDDGKPFKTRSGDTVKLGDLLGEAEERAFKTVNEKSAELPEAQRKEIARVVGLGAVKYADLLPNRQSDYVFSWDKMLALQGNTAPYLLYAYARIKSIFRKAGGKHSTLSIQRSTSNWQRRKNACSQLICSISG